MYTQVCLQCNHKHLQVLQRRSVGFGTVQCKPKSVPTHNPDNWYMCSPMCPLKHCLLQKQTSSQPPDASPGQHTVNSFLPAVTTASMANFGIVVAMQHASSTLQWYQVGLLEYARRTLLECTSKHGGLLDHSRMLLSYNGCDHGVCSVANVGIQTCQPMLYETCKVWQCCDSCACSASQQHLLLGKQYYTATCGL